MNKFIKGALYAFSGFKLIVRPRLRRFVVIPLLINCLLFAGALWLGFNWIESLIGNWLPGWLEWLEYIIWPILVVLALGLIFSSFTLLANLIAAPFNSLLSEAVETRLSNQAIGSNPNLYGLTKNILLTIQSEIQKLLFFGLRAIPLLILFIVPGVNIFAAFIWFLFGAWMLAHEYLDYPLDNHNHSFREQRDLLRKHRALTLGFGAATMLMTLVPVLNFFVMPVAVSGATRLWHEQLRHT